MLADDEENKDGTEGNKDQRQHLGGEDRIDEAACDP